MSKLRNCLGVGEGGRLKSQNDHEKSRGGSAQVTKQLRDRLEWGGGGPSAAEDFFVLTQFGVFL